MRADLNPSGLAHAGSTPAVRTIRGLAGRAPLGLGWRAQSRSDAS